MIAPMLTRSQRSSFDFEGLISPRSPLEFLGFAAINALVGLISAGSPIGFVAVPALAVAWWWWDQRREQQRRLGLVVEKKPPQAARGLILLLSPYDPREPNLKQTQTLQPLVEQLLQLSNPQAADFEAINLFKSNLMPQIQAVAYHAAQGKLRDIWLITTLSYEIQRRTESGVTAITVQGSQQAAEILSHYLRSRYGSTQFDIHTEGLTVQEWQYDQVWQLAESIFQTSGYTDDVIVADVTGGNKMMSVALAMACVPPRRRMQYMDGQRDWQGNPLSQGEIKPLLIDVDPILYNADRANEPD